MAVEIDDEFSFLDISDASQDESLSKDDRSQTLMNPLTGSIVNLKDIDSLILACVDAKQQIDDLKAFEDTLRREIGNIATGVTKTRRVRGKTRTAKVEMPDDTWDNSILKEAWNSYPDLRDEFLRISTISVQLTAFKKMSGTTSDDPKFTTFKNMVTSAKRPPTGAPRVTLEK